MKKIIPWLLLILIIGVGFYTNQRRAMTTRLNEEKPTNNQDELLSDIYPLYPYLKWNKEVVATNTMIPGLKASGYEIKSESISDSTYSSFKESFEEYYGRKLTADGWVQRNEWAAGGPSGDIEGYSKGNRIIIISYDSKENVIHKNEPFSCPCTITLSIFSGTLD
ncbi:MAG TPA: hypothetical protein VF941_16280 [Clostridia bacterium]